LEYSTFSVINPAPSTATAQIRNSVILGRFYFQRVTPSITSSAFSNPTLSEFSGGCLAVYFAPAGSDILITDSFFSDCNIAPPGGGAVVVSTTPARLQIYNTAFVGCSAYKYGGALSTEEVSGGVVLNNTRFVQNAVIPSGPISEVTGSSVWIQGSELTMVNSTVTVSEFRGASAGGAVAFTLGATFDRVTFDDNKGGAVRIWSDLFGAGVFPVVVFRDCLFQSNKGADTPCGGIHVDRPSVSVTVSNTSFLSNTFSNDFSAGALLISGSDVKANISNCMFSSNYAPVGEARTGSAALALFEPTSKLIVINSTFLNNVGSLGSACILVRGGQLEVLGQDTSFQSNTGAEAGKDVHITTALGAAKFVLEHGIPFVRVSQDFQSSIAIGGFGPADPPAEFTIVPPPDGTTEADLTAIGFNFRLANVDCTH
jgi:hypothetical protein